MKYYINLIRNKNYKAIICSIVILMLGCICFYINLKNVIEEGIQNSGVGYSISVINFMIGVISRSNLGMVIIGLLNIYTGLIFAPRNYKGSQNDEDYEIESVGDCIHIKYKNREFLVKKETFEPTDLFFKDKNGKFVSMATGYQIYNYIMYEHKEKTEKEITDGVTIGTEDIITKFSNIRLMNEEEKSEYIEYKKLKYRRRRISFSLSIIFYVMAVLCVFGCILTIQDALGNESKNLTTAIIFFAIGMIFDKISKRQIILIDKIIKGNTYIVDCCSYDKKISSYDGGKDYLIKVTDNNGHYLDKWLKIPWKVYNNNDVVNAKLVITGEDGKHVDIVI